MKKLYCLVKNFFIPHPKNNYKPFACQHKALNIYSAIIISIKVVSLALLSFYPKIALLSPITAENIISLTNQERIAQGFAPLRVDQKLTLAAQNKAKDMLDKDYFSHTSPDGKDPWYWINKAGYDFIAAGENLAADFITSEATHSAWLSSPSHRANILNPAFQDIGVACFSGNFQGKESIVVVEMFGASTWNPGMSQVVPQEKIISQQQEKQTKEGQLETKQIDSKKQESYSTEKIDSKKSESKEQEQKIEIWPEQSTKPSEGSKKTFQRTEEGVRSENKKDVFDLIDKWSKNILLIILALLIVIFLINIFVKIKVQHPKIIAHMLLLITALSILLIL